MSLELLAVVALLGQPTSEFCDSVPACIAEARRVADPSAGIVPAEDAVAMRLQALGPESIDPVIELLADPDPDVRQLAGYAIRGARGLEPRHLEPLRQAMEAGNRWVPVALASIGTPEALESLMQALREEKEQGTQVTFALARLGKAAVPGLVDLFRCRSDCDADLLLVAGAVLEEMGEPAQEAAEPLAGIAADASQPWKNRVRVLQVLGRMGPNARPAISDLLALARGNPGEIRKAAREAVLLIGDESAADVLSDLLREPGPKAWVLRDIASHEAVARAVGPQVESLLASGDPEDRVAAARTLGYVEYLEAAPALTAALDDVADWRLAYTAAESLGRLRAKEARGALEATMEGHWYPPVRGAARIAIRRIDGKEPVPAPSEASFRWEFFDYEQVAARHGFCDALPSAPIVPRAVRRFRATEQPDLAASLAYEPQPGGHARRVVPDVGMRLQGGWLLASDRGEWGGELVFHPDRGPVERVMGGNVADVQIVGRSTLIAVGGLAHLTTNEGAVYRIERDAERGWHAVWWRELPGAPQASWPIAGNQVLIVAQGGSVVLSPDGSLALAPCHTARP